MPFRPLPPGSTSAAWAKSGGKKVPRGMQHIPPWLRGYLVGLFTLALLTIAIRVVYQSPPPRNVFVGALLSTALLVLILGTAWLGYGPGVLVCLLTCFAVPWIVPQANRGL